MTAASVCPDLQPPRLDLQTPTQICLFVYCVWQFKELDKTLQIYAYIIVSYHITYIY